jgi:hypothetical protein
VVNIRSRNTVRRPSSGSIYLSDAFDTPGPTFFKLVADQGLEGMVSKRVDLPYRSGRSKDWLKVKCAQTDYFAIIGYEPRGSGRIANLKLAANDNGALRYAGAVGTGFTAVVMRDLLKRLEPLVQKQSSIADLKAKGTIWTRPELIAEVNYRGVTTTGELRHANFKGLYQSSSLNVVGHLGNEKAPRDNCPAGPGSSQSLSKLLRRVRVGGVRRRRRGSVVMVMMVVVMPMMVVVHRGSRRGRVRSRRWGVRVRSRRILGQRGRHHEHAREAKCGDEFGHMPSNSI